MKEEVQSAVHDAGRQICFRQGFGVDRCAKGKADGANIASEYTSIINV